MENSTTEIFVKAVNGKTVTLEVPLNGHIRDIQQCIQKKLGIPTHEQLLTFGGKMLNGHTAPISSYGIQEYCTLHLTLRLLSKAPTVAVHVLDGSTITVPFSPYSNLIDIKRLVLSHPSMSHLSLSSLVLLHENKPLEADTFEAGKSLWDCNQLHVRVKEHLFEDAAHIKFIINHDVNKYKAQPIVDSNHFYHQSLDTLVRSFFRNSTFLHPLFASPHCPVRSVKIRFKKTAISLPLGPVNPDHVQFFDGSCQAPEFFGLLPHATLLSLKSLFSQCSCCEPTIAHKHTHLVAEQCVDEACPSDCIGIHVELASTGFIFGNDHFYLNQQFYKRYHQLDDEQEKKRHNFQFYPMVKQPSALGEHLLIHGYVRNEGTRNVMPSDVVQLMIAFFPQFHGGSYDVSAHNSSKGKLTKSGKFTIENMDFQLEYSKAAGLRIVILNQFHPDMWKAKWLFQIRCKSTSQCVTAVCDIENGSHLRLLSDQTDQEQWSFLIPQFNVLHRASLMSVICNVQILEYPHVYSHPLISQLSQNAHLLEFEIDANLKRALISKKKYYETHIFYGLFICMIGCSQKTFSIGIQHLNAALTQYDYQIFELCSQWKSGSFRFSANMRNSHAQWLPLNPAGKAKQWKFRVCVGNVQSLC